MAGDPSLSGLNPVFISGGKTLLSFRRNVLASLLGEMNKFNSDSRVLRVDYRQLGADFIRKISCHFGVFPDEQSFQQITRRLQFHSKMPATAFANDTRVKQELFDGEDKAYIEQLLMPLYTEFLHSERESFRRTLHEA